MILLIAAVTVSMIAGWLLGSRYRIAVAGDALESITRGPVASDDVVQVSPAGATFKTVYKVGDTRVTITKSVGAEDMDWITEAWERHRAKGEQQ